MELETKNSELSILKPFDIQKEELHKLVKDYHNLVVTEETLEEAIKARRVLWDIILKAEKILKENKSILNTLKGEQESKADEFISIVSPTKERIDGDIKAIEQKKKDEKARKEKEAMVKITNRTNLLYELGVKVVGSTYSLGEHSIEAVQIKVLSDVEFDQFVELVKAEALIIENQRIEEENNRKELEEQLEKQKQEQEAERKRLENVAKEQKEKEEKLVAEQARIDREAKEKQQKAEQELADKQEQFRKQQEEEQEKFRKQKEELLNAVKNQRIKELDSIGLVFNVSGESFVFEDLKVSMVEIITMEEPMWSKLVDELSLTIHDKKLDNEAQRVIAEKEEQEKKYQEAKLAKKRKKELEPDREKLSRLFTIFTEIEFPECKDSICSSAVGEVSRKTDEIKTYLANTLNTL